MNKVALGVMTALAATSLSTQVSASCNGSDCAVDLQLGIEVDGNVNSYYQNLPGTTDNIFLESLVLADDNNTTVNQHSDGVTDGSVADVNLRRTNGSEITIVQDNNATTTGDDGGRNKVTIDMNIPGVGLLTYPRNDDNSVDVAQKGYRNEIAIEISGNGDDNYFTVVQDGRRHDTIIKVQGGGDDNTVDITLNGDDNNTETIFNGSGADDNTVSISATGSSNDNQVRNVISGEWNNVDVSLSDSSDNNQVETLVSGDRNEIDVDVNHHSDYNQVEINTSGDWNIADVDIDGHSDHNKVGIEQVSYSSEAYVSIDNYSDNNCVDVYQNSQDYTMVTANWSSDNNNVTVNQY
jgi:hypothetical protein